MSVARNVSFSEMGGTRGPREVMLALRDSPATEGRSLDMVMPRVEGSFFVGFLEDAFVGAVVGAAVGAEGVAQLVFGDAAVGGAVG